MNADELKPEIESDGHTVWVNSWFNMARFSAHAGIDIHRPPDIGSTASPCLFCTHGKPTTADWETFKAKVFEHYGVVVDDKHKPRGL